MKRLIVVTLALIIVLFSAAFAEGYSPETSNDYETQRFAGFEVDIRLSVPSSPQFVVDVGILTHGYFNLGGGASLAIADTDCMLGGYAKIGLRTYDILKAQILASTQDSSGLLLAQVNIPTKALVGDILAPVTFGWRGFTTNLNYWESWSYFVGIDAIIANSGAEIWLVVEFPCNDTPRLELGFSFIK